jgi:hypothetical protein
MKFTTALTPEERALKSSILRKERRRVVKSITVMIRIMIETGDTSNAVKLKSALLQMEVAYNRAMLKLTGNTNKKK